MILQTLIVTSAAGLSALYFIRSAMQDLGWGRTPAPGGACGKCASGGCPTARKG